MGIINGIVSIICICVSFRLGLCVDNTGKGTCATTQICYDPETSHMRADWSGINLGISGKTGGGERGLPGPQGPPGEVDIEVVRREVKALMQNGKEQGPPGPQGPPGEVDIEVIRREVKALMQVGGKEQTANTSLEERIAKIEYTLKSLIAKSTPGEKPNIKPGGPKIPPGAIDIYSWVPAPNGYQYLVGSNRQKFEDAREFCKTKKASLASVGIRNEQIKNYLVEKLVKKRNVDVWIGLTDLESESEFYWFDGVKSTAFNTYWDSHQPDGGDCGYLNTNGKIRDYRCTGYSHALCER